MAGGIRRSQEEEVIQMLEREGFVELSEKQIEEEPHKSIYKLPDCFDTPSEAPEPK